MADIGKPQKYRGVVEILNTDQAQGRNGSKPSEYRYFPAALIKGVETLGGNVSIIPNFEVYPIS